MSNKKAAFYFVAFEIALWLFGMEYFQYIMMGIKYRNEYVTTPINIIMFIISIPGLVLAVHFFKKFLDNMELTLNGKKNPDAVKHPAPADLGQLQQKTTRA